MVSGRLLGIVMQYMIFALNNHVVILRKDHRELHRRSAFILPFIDRWSLDQWNRGHNRQEIGMNKGIGHKSIFMGL